jgi:hypothetical protein
MPKTHAQLGINFAQALVDGNFELAASFLAPRLRSDLTPAKLAFELHDMCEYGEGPPTEVHYVQAECEEDWPDKQPDDLGWAYVSIEGSDYCEAVIVTVALIDGLPLIRDVEWGRP